MSTRTSGSDLATTLRFFLDPRAGWGAKLLFLAAIVYLIMPLDLIPDVVVVVGWIDDLVALLGAGTALLLALRRYKAETAAMAQPVRSYVGQRVVDTQGSEVR
jgi:uncharacterized membrane protein YkvA (DUF1232 family)